MCTKTTQVTSTKAITTNSLKMSYVLRDWIPKRKLNNYYLCFNPRAMHIIKKSKKINLDFLSSNPAAIDFLLEDPNRIAWYYFSSNPAAIDFLLEHRVNINWSYLSLNTHPKAIELLEQYPEKIYWPFLCENPSAIHLIEKWSDKIYWPFLSKNPAAMHLLEKNPDKINWQGLSCNPAIFMVKKEDFKDPGVNMKEWAFEYPKEYLKLQVIRRRLMRAYLDPRYKLCRSRLNREFNDL